MSSIMFWMLGISFAAAAMVLTAAMELYGLQTLLSMVIAGFIVLAAIRDHRSLIALNGFAAHAYATLVRHMGMLYAWAAVSIALVYALLIQWDFWFIAFLLMGLGATLCLFLANILMRDLTGDGVDRNVTDLVRSIAKAQFAATCVAFGGLLTFGTLSPSAFGGEAKWVAVNIMLCAAFALAALSGYIVALPAVEADEVDEVDAPAVRAAKPAPGAKKPKTFGRAVRPA
jgi:hypothetical protein